MSAKFYEDIGHHVGIQAINSTLLGSQQSSANFVAFWNFNLGVNQKNPKIIAALA